MKVAAISVIHGKLPALWADALRRGFVGRMEPAPASRTEAAPR